MSSRLSRTGTMTKAAIQQELRKKQIKFDSTALKADLVKLYELEILKNAAGFSTDDDEPSVKITRSTQMSCKQEKESTDIQLKSDESGGDYIRRSPRKSKRTRRLIEEEDEERMIRESKANRLSISLQRIDKMMNDDISDLTDKQLTKELKKHGIGFGPVGPTTRKVYERKLRAAMAEAKEETPVPAQEYSDQEPSEEEEEEEEVIEVVKTPGTVTRSQRQKTLEEESKSSSRSVLDSVKMSNAESKSRCLEKNLSTKPCGPDPTPQPSPDWQVLSLDKGVPTIRTDPLLAVKKGTVPNIDEDPAIRPVAWKSLSVDDTELGFRKVPGISNYSGESPLVGPDGAASEKICSISNVPRKSPVVVGDKHASGMKIPGESPLEIIPGALAAELSPDSEAGCFSSSSEKMKVSFEESILSDQGDHTLEEPIQTPKSMSFSESFGDSPGPIAAVDAGHTPYRRPGLAKLPEPLSSPISTLTHDLLSSRLPRSEYTRRIKAIWYALSRGSATKRRPLHRRRQSEEETIVKEPVKPEPQCKMAKSSSRMPATVQFAILIAIAAFLYFVYITMEENPRLLPFGKEK